MHHADEAEDAMTNCSEDLTAVGPERSLPPFAPLRAYDAVVRFGGIRRAAQHLGLHHSVVSRHLSQLEAWLGVPLLRWSGRRFTVTSAGARFHTRVSGAIAEIAAATSEARDKEAARPIRIWCSHGLSIEWLAAQIAEFERLNSKIDLVLRPSDEPANLLLHEADVNIFMYHDEEMQTGLAPGLKAQLLVRPQAIVAASPALAEQLSWVTSAADLLAAPLLHGRHTDDWRRWFESNGVTTPGHLPGELCWHPHMSLEAARLGRGVLLSNRFFVERCLTLGDLGELRLPGAGNRPFGGYLFIAREDRWTAPYLVTLRRFLVERMQVMADLSTSPTAPRSFGGRGLTSP
ncbi:LysR family transcriptional regulator (plasmid) [Novosphingobium sp. BL-8A]|uniref:LysR family transcriptional regulator n=1 Tax=Novosphingobium sp. BL-8A TaxID=3127639 RepID=UPI0037564056